MSTSLRTILLSLVMMMSAASCQDIADDADNGDAEPLQTGRNSLYQRIGGEPVLNKVMDDLVERARVDPNINWSRPGAPEDWKPTRENFEEFKQGLTRYVSEQIGGPYEYEGPGMRAVHKGMRITDQEFSAFINHLRAALAHHNVPAREQQELIRVFQQTRDQIVQQQAPREQRQEQEQQRRQPAQ